MCSLVPFQDPTGNTCLILIDLEPIHSSVSNHSVVNNHDVELTTLNEW